MLLKGKKALVTGGARGIGKEIVLEFLREGASVWFLDLAPSEFQADMDQAAQAGGGRVVFKKADVSAAAEVARVVEEVASEAGAIDILVNNAGITRDGLIFRMSLENWEKVMAINLTSAFLMSQAVARLMIKQRSGSIINMASIAGVGGNAGQANYASSKAGLIGLTRSLAKETGGRGVRQAFLTQVSMARPGQPQEVARVVSFLASDMSSYVSGTVLRVDGCMSI
jgi:3-oxoacyl-[acyl-carrier protein] reductase